MLSIGDAAISDGMSLHQNGQCRLPDGRDPLSLSARVCSGVTDGTVITATVLHAAPGRWQQMKEQAEQFYSLGLMEGGTVDGQQYTQQQCCIKALELNDQDAEAWDALGNVGGGCVDGQQYTKQQCHDRWNWHA